MAEKPNPIQPEQDPNLEAALANKMVGRGEAFNDELIATASTPKELFEGLRGILLKLEDGEIPHSLSESYRPPGQLSVIFNRRVMLEKTNAQLMLDRKIIKYNPVTGEAIPTKRINSGFAVRTDESPILNSDGQLETNPFTGEPVFKLTHNFGTEKERRELAHAYRRAELEFEARSIIGEWVGTMLNLNIRDSLHDLVNWEHGTTAKLKTEHLEAIFNLPDLKELGNNPDDHTLGDRVEEALFLNLVMLNCATREKMENFLKRPGSQHLIAKMAKEKNVPYDQWILDNIGDVGKWTNDIDRDIETTWKYERRNGYRKKITQWGNIAAFAGNPGDFGKDDEKAFIQQDVGGLVGSVEASWIAWGICRAFGVYASEGYVALPNGKSHLPLGEGRLISGDDRGKFHAYMFNYKEGTRGRPSGLKDMIGKIPDMSINLFDWAQVAMDDLPLKSDGFKERRSIWDAWLGRPAGVKRSLLTGKEGVTPRPREEYHRLGSLKFDSLDPDFHGTFGIMHWLAGDDSLGVLPDALKIDVKFEDFSLNDLKKKNKYKTIVLNANLLAQGSPYLYEDPVGDAKIIQKNMLRNVNIARIRSVSFKLNVLNQTIAMLEPDISELGIPAPVLVREFVREALKDNPKNEDEIKAHYIDEYSQITELGQTKIGPLTLKTAGNSGDRFAVLQEEFLPIESVERQKALYVGPVIGRKVK